MKKLLIDRLGATRELTDEEIKKLEKGITMSYLRRLVKFASDNEVVYLDINTGGKTRETMRMMFNKIAKETNQEIRTVTFGDLFGFVIVNPKEVFI